MRPAPVVVFVVLFVLSLAPSALGSAQSTQRLFVPIANRGVAFEPIGTTAPATSTPAAATRTPTPRPGATSTPTSVPTVTPTATGSRIDVTKLPRGDGKLSTTSAQVGYIFSCRAETASGPNTTYPWVDYAANTWNSTTKVTVDGSVSWTSQFNATTTGSTRQITSNGLPSHPSGSFPISSSDDASLYDRNPGSIGTQSLNFALPKSPTANSSPTCISSGTIGIMLTGPVFFHATDAETHDAPAREIQDACGGHPAGTLYHYHLLSPCATDTATGHSALMGYVLDGFGIYGHRGESGETLINADLDVCHGHTHSISWDGATTSMYHYHATYEFPYTVGCYRGTPASAPRAGASALPQAAAAAPGSWRGRATP